MIGKSLLLAMLALAAFWDASALAQQAAPFDVYAIPVHVDQTAASANAARDAARLEGERHAYIRMLSRLTRASDAARLPPANNATLDDLIQGFEVANERRSAVRYFADYTYHFRPDAVRALLRQAQIPFAEAPSRPLVVLPVLEGSAGAGPVLWDAPNPWRNAWNQANFPPGLVPLILPLGDAADLAAADAPAADRGDDAALASISRRYNGADVLVTRASIKPGAPEAVDVNTTRYSPGSSGDNHTWIASYVAGPGEAEPDLLLRAAAGTDAQLEEAWKAVNVIDFGQAGTLAVNAPVSDLQSWAALNAKLAGISVIQRADLLSLNRQMAHILIHYVGDPSQLRLALAQNNLDLSGDPSSLVLVIRGGAASP
ncbi:MAG TPA: DUF2066 domain-containing protein [Stellaceae bacterium]|nr:DUF2066 domain-containing protein [Stellaceae bacterium]